MSTSKPTGPAPNVITTAKGKGQTDLVHRGRWARSPLSGNWVAQQACGGRRMDTDWGIPTDKPITCSKCGGAR